MNAKPDFAREGADWPHRDRSRFVIAGGLRWHVQTFGPEGRAEAPRLLLLHGAGAATHTWRDLAPRLAETCAVFALDLPGHGFTDTPRAAGLTLPGMAELVGRLIAAEGFAPDVILAHSAGAAIGLEMIRRGMAPGAALIGLNAALRPFPGVAGKLFPGIARALALNPLTPRLAAWRANDRRAIARLIEGTGSKIDARGIDLYRRLFATPGHVEATLGMMASWDLEPLQAALPSIEAPITLIAAAEDRAVPPDVSTEAARRAPRGRSEVLPKLGHLAHEEAPELLAERILDAVSKTE